MKLLLIFLLSCSLFSFDLQKANIYDEKKHNINNWYMSEKLDGIRAYWNGKELLSKNGNKIFAPTWFIKDFPSFELDGELWTKRDDFENIQNIVLDTNSTEDWKKITYNIFELPNSKGNFPKRLKKLENWLTKNPNNYIKIIPQIICKDKTHLNNYLKELIEKKAEGIIIKNPNLNYQTEKNNNLLKVKTFLDDEAIVINHNYKNDKFKSLVVKLKNGVIFNLGGGFSVNEKINPPKIGEIITYKYYGLTKNGKPKFASFLRVRKNE
jgi:DNA ligase-1